MIRDPESGWVEASITINGVPLTFAEAMTIRVAVSSFAMYVAHPENHEALGAIADGYRHHLNTVMEKLVHPS